MIIELYKQCTLYDGKYGKHIQSLNKNALFCSPVKSDAYRCIYVFKQLYFSYSSIRLWRDRLSEFCFFYSNIFYGFKFSVVLKNLTQEEEGMNIISSINTSIYIYIYILSLYRFVNGSTTLLPSFIMSNIKLHT